MAFYTAAIAIALLAVVAPIRVSGSITVTIPSVTYAAFCPGYVLFPYHISVHMG